MTKRRLYEFGGKLWRLDDLSQLFGKNLYTVRQRMRAGMSLSDALNKPLHGGQRFLVNGVQMRISELAKALGMHRSALYARLSVGWRKDELIAPRQIKRGVTAWGRTQSLSAWAREVGINRATLQWRIESGLSPEVAFRLPVDKAQSRKKGRQE